MDKQYIRSIDPVTGRTKIFSTIAEAARALSVDASNIRKVLKNSRKTAGGFAFEYTLKTPTTTIGKKAIKAEREAKFQKDLLKKVHDRLKDINQRYFNALITDSYNNDPILQQLMSHTNYFGARKKGGYNIDISHLKQFSNTELKNLMLALNAEQHKYVEIAAKPKSETSTATIAYLFGIPQNRVSEFESIIPILFDLLHLIKQDDRLKYREIQETIFEAIQNGLDADELEDYIDDLTEAYYGNDMYALDNVLEKIANVDDEYKDIF